MQRSALAATCLVCFLLAGCKSASRVDSGTLPKPATSTGYQRPFPAPVVRPPLRPQPRPHAPAVVRAAPPAPAPSPPAAPGTWFPPGGIRKGRWQCIVVHHAASDTATPAGMDDYHRNVRGWENGLGYDFVIGNGVNYPDGQVFVGDRWKRQIQGAHCATSSGRYFGVWRPDRYFNEHGVGICLIGNLENSRPTAAQLAALKRLIGFLTVHAGVTPTHVYGHGEVTQKSACPGRHLNVAALRQSGGITAASD